MIFNREKIIKAIVLLTLLVVSTVGCNSAKKDSKEVVPTNGGTINVILDDSKVEPDRTDESKGKLPRPAKINLYKSGNVKEMHLGKPLTEKLLKRTERLVYEANFKDNRVWSAFAGINSYDLVVELIYDVPIKFDFKTKIDDTITRIYLVRDGEDTIFFARYSFLNNDNKKIDDVAYATIVHPEKEFWETVQLY